MITGINELKTLKHTSCKCKCEFDDRKCNSNQKWNNNNCWCEYKTLKKHNECESDYMWNLATCSCENGKYAESIIDNLIIMCDEIIETAKSTSTKTVSINFNVKKVTCKTENFYILIVFLLIIIALLIALSIYWYQI